MLSYPPNYDGIGYVLAAKSSFYAVQSEETDPTTMSRNRWVFEFVPLWEALMLLSFWLLGEGEWQAFTVRFWPTLLLLLLLLLLFLLLTFWVVRKRGSATVGWVAVLFTALLPTVSVSLRTSGWEYLAGVNLGRGALGGFGLADLRPDLLSAVLLLWAVVPLIENVNRLDRPTWFLSGTAAALAILVKSSTTPVLLLAGGLTVVYVFTVNRHRFLTTAETGAWGLFPFATLLTPWLLAGGPRTMITYLSHNLTAGRPLWSIPNTTFLAEATHYWWVFPHHMGWWEGWVFLGLGLLFWIAKLRRREGQESHRLLAYLLVAGAVYGVVSATPNKNFFVGLNYYLLLWLFSWATLASSLTVLAQRSRMAFTCLILFAALYGGFVMGAAFYALQNWPEEKQLRPPQNREVTQLIARDLRRILGKDDTFVWIPLYGCPAALQYYMMDELGRFPQAVWIDPVTSPPIPQFLREEVSPSKAVLVFEDDIEEVAKYFPVHPMSYTYWRAISEWVRRPDSPHRLVGTYRLWGQYPDHPILVHLYVRESDESDRGRRN